MRESEAMHRAIFNNAGIGIDLLDSTGRFAQVNKTLANILGYSPDELRGLSFSDISHPDDRDISRHRLESLLSGEIDGYRLEKRYMRKDGRTVWCALYVSAIRDTKGKHSGTVGVIEDISDRKLAEKQLCSTMASLESAQRLANLGSWSYNLQTRELNWSSEMFKICGVDPEQGAPSYGRHKEFVHPEDWEFFSDAMRRVANGGEGHELELRIYRPDKSVCHVLTRAEPEYDQAGKVAGLYGTIQDISGRKLHEQERDRLRSQLVQSQKMEAIGTLVGGLAHDFNNMLQVVIGYADLLLMRKKRGDPDHKELEAVIKTAQEGADLVQRLLLFGKEARTHMATMDLNNQIDELAILLSRTILKMVKLEVDLTEEPAIIRADKSQVDQIILNLGLNASEAMPAGGVLKIQTRIVNLDQEYSRERHEVKSGRYVMLSILDTGRGMDQQTVSKIFEPFFSTKERGSTRGTGLGLSVVLGIVEKHGGHITCESEPGRGTIFRIYFPAVGSQPDSSGQISSAIEPGGTKTILLIEDDQSVADLCKRVLSDAGYTVITAMDGPTALDMYRERKDKISLVILDLILPGMSGKDCLKELVKVDPSVSVLICTGFSPDRQTQEEIDPLVKGFVNKPYGATRLLEAVSAVLGSV